jgi:hypothetical protein
VLLGIKRDFLVKPSGKKLRMLWVPLGFLRENKILD